MAGVVKWLTHQIVALTFGGSIPLTRLFINNGVSPSGKARDFDSLMRWFESSYPSFKIAGVAELADALDSKSSVLTDVPVRPRPPVL